MSARLLKRPPVGTIRPVVRHALQLDDWRKRVLAYATAPLLCVYEPGFRVEGAERFELHDWPTDPSEWHNTPQQQAAFAAFNYARWRLIRAADQLRGQPLGIRACRELMQWAGAALRIRDRLTEANWGLVCSAVRRFCPTDSELAESDCVESMLQAVDRFDRSQGRFSTYATTAVHRRLYRRWKIGKRPVPAQLIAEGMPAPAIEWTPATDTDVVALATSEVLDARERIVIRSRFGLNGTKPVTLQVLADQLKLSREGVRQVQDKAIVKLRQYLGISVL